jgi:curved DNA-binding protein CbpA
MSSLFYNNKNNKNFFLKNKYLKIINNNNKYNKYNTIIYFSLKNFTKIDLNKDYYKILGLTPEASNKDIKNAYLKCVKKYHPDLNEGKTTEIFKEISNSFKILSDDELKRYYDSNILKSSSSYDNNYNYSTYEEKKKKAKETKENIDIEDFDFENRQKFYEKKQKNRNDKTECPYGTYSDDYNNNYTKNYWGMMLFYFDIFKDTIRENPQYIPRFIFYVTLYLIFELFFRREHGRYHLFEGI